CALPICSGRSSSRTFLVENCGRLASRAVAPGALHGTFSMVCCGCCERAHRGQTCRGDIRPIKRATDGFSAGSRPNFAQDFGGTSTRPRNTRRDRGRGGLHRRDLRSGKKRGDLVGRCRAGNATKVMAIADRDGLPLALYLASGNRFDSVLTDGTLDAAFVAKLPPRLIGDKAWDAAPLQQRLKTERGIELIAPKR